MKQAWRRVATDVRGGTADGGGHWIPEERCDWALQQLLDFFRKDEGQLSALAASSLRSHDASSGGISSRPADVPSTRSAASAIARSRSSAPAGASSEGYRQHGPLDTPV